jgi:DNA-binding MarR family transcriptional regulator
MFTGMYNTYVNDSASPQTAFLPLVRGADAVQSFIESRLATVELSLPKLVALYWLMKSGESLPLGQLAERISCVKSNVTQLIDRLEADGLVARAPDPNDRRSRLAVITAKGKQAYEDGIRIKEAAEHELFGGLTKDETQQLAALLGKIQARTE